MARGESAPTAVEMAVGVTTAAAAAERRGKRGGAPLFTATEWDRSSAVMDSVLDRFCCGGALQKLDQLQAEQEGGACRLRGENGSV